MIFSIARGIDTPLFYMTLPRISLDASLHVSKLMLICYLNQILVERSRFAFIIDMKYEKLFLFCSNCKIISHDLSNC